MDERHRDRRRAPEPDHLPGLRPLGAELLLFYKQGKPDASHIWVKRWVPSSQRWASPLRWPNNVERPLIHGEIPPVAPVGDYRYGQYFTVAQTPSDGALHLVWTWVPQGGSDAAQDLSYVVSRDGGFTWTTKEPPYVSHRFYRLGTANRGAESVNVDHVGWSTRGELTPLDTYLAPGTTSASPNVTVSSAPARAIP